MLLLGKGPLGRYTETRPGCLSLFGPIEIQLPWSNVKPLYYSRADQALNQEPLASWRSVVYAVSNGSCKRIWPAVICILFQKYQHPRTLDCNQVTAVRKLNWFKSLRCQVLLIDLPCLWNRLVYRLVSPEGLARYVKNVK